MKKTTTPLPARPAPPKSLLILSALLFAFGAARAQDDGGNAIHVTTTLHSDGTRTVTQTDPDNHTSQLSTYDQAGKLLQKIVFNTDEQGQSVIGLVYSPKGKLLFKTKYVRDSSNRVIETDNYTPGDVFLSRFVYHYGANNRVTNIDSYDANGNLVNSSNPNRPDKKKGR